MAEISDTTPQTQTVTFDIEDGGSGGDSRSPGISLPLVSVSFVQKVMILVFFLIKKGNDISCIFIVIDVFLT